MGALLYNALVAPLMDLYAALFNIAAFLGVGGCIVAFSLTINLFLLPLYSQMERRSRATRGAHAAVAIDVERMKRHFRGRERYFYIRAVYRQHAFNPLSQLLSSADLFVQILVFATVFHFLSHYVALEGASFGPLRDLSRPDGLLGGFNLLPFVMTAINAAAVWSYIEDRGKRTQAWVLSALFLALLYASPSGLVLYWTANNLFSLIRNIVRRRLASAPASPLTQRLSDLQGQQ
jgi:membrane protein insertase Oxa1/YidC/SpoIIIJ